MPILQLPPSVIYESNKDTFFNEVSMKIILSILMIILCLPKMAHAYVDPGLISMVSQWAYIVVSGLVLVLFVNPWNYLKAFFSKKKAQIPAEDKK
jgi:hypothetical protein